jgi:hypothetical protein
MATTAVLSVLSLIPRTMTDFIRQAADLPSDSYFYSLICPVMVYSGHWMHEIN